MAATPQARATYLRTVQDWIIAPRMRTAAGLAGVDVNGGYVKEFAVRPDAARLASYGLGLSDLIQALENANTQAGAGYVQRSGEALTVRTDALAQTIPDLAQAPVVNRNGLVVRVADVATVEVGQAPRLGGASRDGHEAVIGTALMLAGGNSRTVAQAAAERLEEILLDGKRVIDRREAAKLGGISTVSARKMWRALGMAQPTLGRQVTALERELGVALFERVGRGLTLTPSGLELMDHVRAMGEAAALMSLSASGRAQAIEGTVSISASAIPVLSVGEKVPEVTTPISAPSASRTAIPGRGIPRPVACRPRRVRRGPASFSARSA